MAQKLQPPARSFLASIMTWKSSVSVSRRRALARLWSTARTKFALLLRIGLPVVRLYGHPVACTATKLSAPSWLASGELRTAWPAVATCQRRTFRWRFDIRRRTLCNVRMCAFVCVLGLVQSCGAKLLENINPFSVKCIYRAYVQCVCVWLNSGKHR